MQKNFKIQQAFDEADPNSIYGNFKLLKMKFLGSSKKSSVKMYEQFLKTTLK